MSQPTVLAFYSEREASCYLSVSLSTIRRWRRNSTGPDFFRFGGILRYSRAALDRFIESNTVSPQPVV